MSSSISAACVQVRDDLRLRRAILAWFRKYRRPLPWRLNRDPYAVWVSEIMLQQTQIATVVPFYERFLRTFPTVTSLAQAPLERVLQLWSGLGYYRRARNLHAAARQIVSEFAGSFPREPEQARALPGIGRYTAAAVLSIAYGVPLAALDGNVARVIARLDGRKGSLAEPAFRKAIETRLASLLSRRSPGDFNQAMMELGQTVCLPRAPRCLACPVRRACCGHKRGNPEDFPSPRPRRSTEEHYLAAALAFRRHGESGLPKKRPSRTDSSGRERDVLVVRGLDDGLMPDLWNFPSALGASPAAARSKLELKLASLGMGPVIIGPEVARLRHSITYRDIRVRVYDAQIPEPSARGLSWLGLARFHKSAVSQLARKIAAAIAPGPE
jgi:A/G-specific adenine glycosylase